MKKTIITLLSLSTLLILSCSKDFVSSEVSYTKATAIYGDLSELRDIPLVSETKELINPGKVFVSEDLLLIGEENEGIHVYNNTDPESPEPVLFINIPRNKEFFVKDNIIYAESLYDMLKIDITDSSNPTLVRRIENSFSQDLTNNNGEVLTGFTFEKVTEKLSGDDQIWELNFDSDPIFFDYQNKIIPASAVPSSFAGSSSSSIGTVNRIAHHRDYVYVISNSTISVFSDKESFNLVSWHALGWDMETIYPYNNNLFVGGRSSMTVYDIMDPENPIHQGQFIHGTACDPVLPAGDVTYVTLRTGDEDLCPGDQNALVVLNTSELFNPTSVEEIEMKSPYGMTIIGDKLYVGEGSNGLKIFEIVGKYELELLKYDKDVQAYDIIAHPTRSDLILVASPDGFGQYEIEANSDNLSLVSWISN